MKRQTYYIYSHSVNGELLYIGMGTKARLRSSWDRSPEWDKRIEDAKKADLRILARFYSRTKASRVEKALIRFCQPPCNVFHNPAHIRRREIPDWARIKLLEKPKTAVGFLVESEDRERLENACRLVKQSLSWFARTAVLEKVYKVEYPVKPAARRKP
jgi:predicted GIY-YIG superfamily endonuclease